MQNVLVCVCVRWPTWCIFATGWDRQLEGEAAYRLGLSYEACDSMESALVVCSRRLYRQSLFLPFLRFPQLIWLSPLC